MKRVLRSYAAYRLLYGGGGAGRRALPHGRRVARRARPTGGSPSGAGGRPSRRAGAEAPALAFMRGCSTPGSSSSTGSTSRSTSPRCGAPSRSCTRASRRRSTSSSSSSTSRAGRARRRRSTTRSARSSRRIRVPRVIVLLAYDHLPKARVRFSRFNIYARDDNTCQYCGRRFRRAELNLDHVVPRSRGGSTTWENVVCSCIPCNLRKGGRTPEEARMRLLRAPTRPRWTPMFRTRDAARVLPRMAAVPVARGRRVLERRAFGVGARSARMLARWATPRRSSS